ncbi:MAG TPA: VIT domain-containing protein, partial [Gemmatimonadales bacterium]|nr:VIT domain-containing protein [Gemmatimonadales bacterium]
MAVAIEPAASRGAAALALAAGLAAVPAPLPAQGWLERETSPDIAASRVTRASSTVRVTVDGRTARVEVRERFRNDGRAPAEGSYLYPLPEGAAFQNFALWMGDQELRGEVMQAGEARSIYEAIVRRRRDPALLTLAGHGLLRARVFPIAPGETRKVVLRYTQLLTRVGDALRLRYPLGAREPAVGAVDLRIRIEAESGFGTPYSPTHRVESRRVDDGLEFAVETARAGDVELFLPLRSSLVSMSLATHAPVGEDGYFMLLVSPPPPETVAAIPRDLTLLLDVSGSMAGTKLERARAALRGLLATLGDADRFRLLAFSSSVREFRPGQTAVTPAALGDAGRWVDRLTADGGTDIGAALDAALRGVRDRSRLSLIILLTDGLPSVGERAPDRIAERAARRRDGARIFPLGVGEDVNTYLLDRLGKEGRGAVEYVASGADVERALGAVAAKIRYPALVNLRIADAPVRLYDCSPDLLPDLFSGEELVVFGRYRGHGAGPLVVTGERNGRAERFTLAAEFPVSAWENEYVPRMWATRRVGDLTRQIRLEGRSGDLVSEVRELGLRHGILTEYTSYLVREPTLALGVGAPEPPPHPTEQTGAKAFDAARRSAKLAAAANLPAADEAAAGPEREGPAMAGPGSAVRSLAGRVFVRRGRVWTDALDRDSLQETAVAPYTP